MGHVAAVREEEGTLKREKRENLREFTELNKVSAVIEGTPATLGASKEGLLKGPPAPKHQ